MNSVAEATMDFMTQDPANAKKHSKVGFRCSMADVELIF